MNGWDWNRRDPAFLWNRSRFISFLFPSFLPTKFAALQPLPRGTSRNYRILRAHPLSGMGRSNPPPMALPPALNIHFFRLFPPLSLKSAPTPQSPPLRSDQSQLQPQSQFQPQPQPQPPPQPFNFVSNLKASLQYILSFNSFAPSVPPVAPVTDPSPPTCCTVPLFRPYVAKVPWHGGPRALLSRLFPRYGHYCGPNWSSGKEAGSMLWDRRPIDWLDHCCYCHDIGYDTHDQVKLLKADLAFLECLERPRMATKGGAYMSIIYRAMCIAGLRSFLIPYRTHLVRLQSGPSLFDYFSNVFAKIPSISKGAAENQKVRF